MFAFLNVCLFWFYDKEKQNISKWMDGEVVNIYIFCGNSMQLFHKELKCLKTCIYLIDKKENDLGLYNFLLLFKNNNVPKAVVASELVSLPVSFL